MKTHRITFINCICLAVLLLLYAVSAHAVVIEPSRHEITVSAGTTARVSFSLINQTTEIMNVTSSVRPYFPMATETAMPPDKDSPHAIKSCESWITSKLESVQINPGVAKEFTLSIAVPENASGEYAAYISFDQSADVDNSALQHLLDNESKNAITDMEIDMVLRRSVPVYVFIENTTAIQGELIDVSASNMLTDKILDNNYTYTNNFIKISAVLRNTGSRHIRAKGSIVILDSEGNLTDTVPTGITWPILPGYTETIPVYWESPGKTATYTGIINLELGDDIILQREIEFSVDEKGFLVQ